MEKTVVNPLLNSIEQTFVITDSQFRVVEHKNGNGLRSSLEKLRAERCSIFSILPDLEQKKGYLDKVLSKELSQFEINSTTLKIDDSPAKKTRVVIKPNYEYGDKNGLLLLFGDAKTGSPAKTRQPAGKATELQAPGNAAFSCSPEEELHYYQSVLDSLPFCILYRNIESDEIFNSLSPWIKSCSPAKRFGRASLPSRRHRERGHLKSTRFRENWTTRWSAFSTAARMQQSSLQQEKNWKMKSRSCKR